MSEYVRMVEAMECDFHRHMPPSQILSHCLSVTQIDITGEGCGRNVIFPQLGAVWMISRMRIYQYANINVGDVIKYRTFPRVIENNKYIYYVEIYRGDELVVRFDTSYIPVNFTERKIMRLSLFEPLWSGPPRRAVTKGLRKIRADCDFSDCGSDVVRLSDCDSNGHMTSAAYLSLACDALDFWNGDKDRLMQMIQVDFLSEVRPGTELSFQRGEKDGVKYMRSLKPDGRVAFAAACIF